MVGDPNCTVTNVQQWTCLAFQCAPNKLQTNHLIRTTSIIWAQAAMTCKHNKIWCAKEKALQHIFHPLSCNPAAKYQQLSVQSSQENEESSECIDTSGVEAQEVFFCSTLVWKRSSFWKTVNWSNKNQAPLETPDYFFYIQVLILLTKYPKHLEHIAHCAHHWKFNMACAWLELVDWWGHPAGMKTSLERQ